MARAIDLHVHPSTREWVDGAMGEFRPACEDHFHTRLPEHSVDEMAEVFRTADVLGVLLAWDAETHTGNPPVSNDFVAGCVAAHPDAFLGFASVDPHKSDAVVELERAVRFLGLRGLKMHPGAQGFSPDDRAVYPIWETAAALGIPVLIHTGTTGLGAGMRGGGGVALSTSNPMLIDRVALDFPDLQIVMAHPAWPWQDEQLAVLAHKPNTWIDLSGWSPKRFAPELVRELRGRLQDRALFGTDYPFLTHEQWLGAWGTLDIPDAITEKILLTNATRLLGL
ncbi:MAG: amidohydrolase family protein [Actinomycetes bacterium]